MGKTNESSQSQYIMREADFTIPEGWEEVPRPEAGIGAPNGAAPVDRLASGAIASTTLGLQTDIAGSQIAGSIPVFRVQPPQPSSNAAGNAGTLSTTKQISDQASFAAILADTANQNALQALSATWQGAWSSIITYALGAIVESAGAVYVSLANQNLGNSPASSPTFWMATGQVQFFGAWSSTVTYGVGALVDYNGLIYVGIQAGNLNNTPSSSPTFWTATGSESFAGAWSSATAYTTGQTVTESGSLYIALQDSTNENPTSTTGFWQLLTGSVVQYGVWSSTQAYPVGAQVLYNGSYWIATAANTNETPAPGSSFWENVGTSAILLAAWNNSVAYSIGMEVTNAGNIFQCIQANTNQTPPTPPATSVYWQCIGPTNLGNLPNGSENFSATAAGLSYRPTTNPLSSVDAGSNATIDIASFNLQTSSQGLISYNSGSITALSYGTLYYIYLVDASLAGGSTTYFATTSKTTALDGSGNIFIGSITTAISGGQEVIGNNDGGVGTQSGSQTLFLGTLATPTTANGGTVTNPTNAIDGNTTTFALLATGSPTSSSATLTLSGYAGQQLLTPATLNVLSKVVFNEPTTTTAELRYSLNGGSTWTNIYNITASRPLTNDQVTIPIGQNLGLVQVQAIGTSSFGVANAVEISLYEAYIVLIQ
jgi:hypothetical protein